MAAGSGHGSNPLNHVVDNVFLDLPWGETHLPRLLGVQVTRFMVMELVAAALLLVILIPLTRHVARYPVSRGPFWNAFEAMLLFIRDNVARPALGGHGADGYLPFLWTMFFFILVNNLLGMIPGGASATANINVTAVLALMTFGVVLAAGIKASGPVGYWVNLVPKLDVPPLLKGPLWGLLFLIEVVGLFIRHLVLAVRLFANMLAGHIVLAVILGFAVAASGYLKLVVAPVSVLGVVALSFLELLVAFLQAYIFVFLAALFIGSAAHPEH